ncbi:MAG: alpha-galactosidase [Lentisphaeria bacterium]
MQMQLQPAKNYYRREVLLDLPAGSDFVYHTGNNMSMMLQPTGVFYPNGFCSEFTSDDVIVVGDPRQKKFVLVGAVTARRSLTFLILIKKGSNMHSIEVRQPDILEGETPEEVLVLKGNDWRKLLIQYAETTCKKMNVPAFNTDQNVTGYCTWYYYYASVKESEFLENLEALNAKKDSCYSAQVVQIDDGYQTFQGDWNDQDPAWPTPLNEIGEKIMATGMQPGIWLMPFQASTASRVFREHPDWFVKDQNGEPKVAKGWSPPPDDLWACLDTTNPAVLTHLAKVFRTFEKWGYTYFKMDGLGFGLMDGIRMDPNATPVSAFRKGLQTIRAAVPTATLLGCCPPFMPCLGLVDSCRISGDTKAWWHMLRNAMLAVISRWWMYDRYFRCDPDVIIARQDRSVLTIGESRISILTGIMTGISITSDNLKTIAPERLELLGRAAKLRMRDVMPLKWEQNTWPQVFTGTVDGRKSVAIINIEDHAIDYSFEEIGLNKEEEVDELLQPLGKRKYMITVPSHDAVLLVQ